MTISGKITLKKGKEISIRRFHPWIFSGAIQKIEGEAADGDWVEVQDASASTLGFGHYQNGSIAVRMLSFSRTAPAENFWEEKLANAFRLRAAAGLPSDTTNALRLIHGEGDGLPGLIIDYYDGVAIIQAHSVGMHHDRVHIAAA